MALEFAAPLTTGPRGVWRVNASWAAQAYGSRTADPVAMYLADVCTIPVNIAGLPAVNVPGGEYDDGTPFSVIFVGPLWSEAKLLALAYDYEQATQHRVIPQLTAQ